MASPPGEQLDRCRFRRGFATVAGLEIQLRAPAGARDLPRIRLFGTDQDNGYKHLAKHAGRTRGRDVVEAVRHAWPAQIVAVMESVNHADEQGIEWILESERFRERFGTKRVTVATRPCPPSAGEGDLCWAGCPLPTHPAEPTMRSVRGWSPTSRAAKGLYPALSADEFADRFASVPESALREYAIEPTPKLTRNRGRKHIYIAPIRIGPDLVTVSVLADAEQADCIKADKDRFAASHRVHLVAFQADGKLDARFKRIEP